jgi:predicted HTH domain antitoxin
MDTVQVEVPAALLKAADLDSSNVSQEASRLLALELFREDRISLGRAAELSGTPLASFMDFVARHAIFRDAGRVTVVADSSPLILLSKIRRFRCFRPFILAF